MKKTIIMICLVISFFIIGCSSSNYVSDKEVDDATVKIEQIRQDIKNSSELIRKNNEDVKRYVERAKYYMDEYKKSGKQGDLDMANYYYKKIDKEIFGE